MDCDGLWFGLGIPFCQNEVEQLPPWQFILLWQNGMPAPPPQAAPIASLPCFEVAPASADTLRRSSRPGSLHRSRAGCVSTCICLPEEQQVQVHRQQTRLTLQGAGPAARGHAPATQLTNSCRHAGSRPSFCAGRQACCLSGGWQWLLQERQPVGSFPLARTCKMNCEPLCFGGIHDSSWFVGTHEP